MVDIKEAVKYGVHFLKEMYEDKEISDITLEEIEMSEDSNHWLVTMSFIRPKATENIHDVFSPKEYERTYKILKVSRDDGCVISMMDRMINV